jgi:thiopurine S-methyltransferase
MVDKQHWHDRWRENRIGFHEETVNPHLQEYLSDFGLSPGDRIFVPLCGKAVDMAWLAGQGYEVLGVELSPIALQAFFAEQGLDYECIDTDRFSEYRGEGITLLQGDFFDLRADDLRDCALVYDRAALIAMPASARPAYYRHMLSILPPRAGMLLITLEYDQADMQGPPFSTPETEVREYYGGTFTIRPLDRFSIIDERPRWRDAGLSAIDEAVFRLDR